MTILVRELRERALKATPGPWQHERLGIIQGGPVQTYVNGAAMPQLFTSHAADFMEPGDYLANADFVAAANPAAILALLDEQDQLKAENAELRRDAERYRWVRQPVNGNKVFAMAGNGECGGNMDAAIDQAMTKEQQP